VDEEKVWCRIVFKKTEDGFEVVVKGKDCDKLFED